MEKLCERIYALRKDAGLSQEELGRRTGVSRQTISKWESGAMVPESSNLRALCVLFGVSADYLLFGKEAESAAPPAQQAQPEQTQGRSAQETEDLRYKQALYLCAAIFMGALTLLALAVTGAATYLLLAGIPFPWQEEQAPLSFLLSPAVLLGVALFFSIMLATFTILIAVAFLRTRRKLKS